MLALQKTGSAVPNREALSRVLPALFPTEAAQEVSALEPLTAGRTEM